MRGLLLIGSAVAVVAAASVSIVARAPGQAASLPAPGFHHLHLNSINPEAAIAFYMKQFPTTPPTTFAGQPALRSPNNVWVLFNRVDAPPPTQPPTAFWHFGWHVTDVRKSLERTGSTRRDAAAALHRRWRTHGVREQRHLARQRRRARPHTGQASRTPKPKASSRLAAAALPTCAARMTR